MHVQAWSSVLAELSPDEIAEAFCALLIPAPPAAGHSVCFNDASWHAFHAELLHLAPCKQLPSFPCVYTTQVWLQVWQCLCSVQAVLGFDWLLVAAWRPPWQALWHVCVHSYTGWWPGSHCVFRYLSSSIQACCNCLMLVFLQHVAARTISSSRAYLNLCL